AVEARTTDVAPTLAPQIRPFFVRDSSDLPSPGPASRDSKLCRAVMLRCRAHRAYTAVCDGWAGTSCAPASLAALEGRTSSSVSPAIDWSSRGVDGQGSPTYIPPRATAHRRISAP